jgi:hypothetical protein
MLESRMYHEQYNPKNYASSLVVQLEMQALSDAGQLTPELKFTLDRTIEFLQDLEEQFKEQA